MGRVPRSSRCQTFGDTLAETMEDAQEALAAYLVTLLSDGTPIPAPSPIQEIKRMMQAPLLRL